MGLAPTGSLAFYRQVCYHHPMPKDINSVVVGIRQELSSVQRFMSDRYGNPHPKLALNCLDEVESLCTELHILIVESES